MRVLLSIESHNMLSGLLLLAVQSPNPAPVRGDPRPDLLVIVLDDVAAADVETVPTPNIDFLASQGVSFRRGYAAETCVPTRYGILFGEYLRSSFESPCNNREPLSPPLTQVALADLLETRGYRTAAFGKWHVGSNPLGDWEMSAHLHGFDDWLAASPSNLQLCGGRDYWNWLRVDNGVSQMTTEYQTTAVRDAFISWWSGSAGPRFAYVCFQAAHVPLHVPPAAILPPNYPTPVTDREKYEAMLVSADWVIGEMLAVVNLRQTWVVVIGDNGTPPQAAPPGQSPNRFKGTTFEGGVRVPFVVAGPGIARPFETQALVHAVDLNATLAELAGAKIPPGTSTASVSFVPCFSSPDARVRSWVFCDWDFTIPPNVAKPPKRDRAIITQRYKLRRVGSVIEELYDLERDPGEIHPLDPHAPDHARVGAELGRLLDAVE